MVLDFAHIRHDGGEAGDGRDGHGIEQVLRGGLIVLDVTADAIVEHGEVETEVETGGLLPLEVGILHRSEFLTHCSRNAVAEDVADAGVDLGERRVAAGLVTADTPTCTKLQVVDAGDVEPALIGEHPTEGYRWEDGRLVVGREARETITTHGGGDEVAAVVGVVDAVHLIEQGLQPGVGVGGLGRSELERVVAEGHAWEELGIGSGVAVLAARSTIDEGCTYGVLAEVVGIVEDVIEGVIVVGGVVLVSLAVVVLGIFACIVVLTDTIVVTIVHAVGETLERQLHLGVEVGEERVVAIVVIDHRTVIRILARIVCGIINDDAVLVVRMGERAALDEEGEVGLLSVTILERAECLHTGLEPLGGLDIDVDADGVTLVVVVEEVVLLGGVAYGNEVGHGIAAARDVELVLLDLTCAGEVAPPVVVAGHDVALAVGHPRVGHTRSEVEVGILLGVARCFGLGVEPEALVVEVEHLLTVHDAEVLGRLLDAVAARERNLGLALGTLLGGDEEYAIGSLCTIDGGGRSILQHIDALDVGRVDGGKTAGVDDTVEHDEHAGVTRDGVGATHGDRWVGTCGTCLAYVQAGDGALKGLQQVGVGRLLECFNVRACDCAREVALLHGAVTNHYDVVEQLVVFGQNDAKVIASFGGNLL